MNRSKDQWEVNIREELKLFSVFVEYKAYPDSERPYCHTEEQVVSTLSRLIKEAELRAVEKFAGDSKREMDELVLRMPKEKKRSEQEYWHGGRYYLRSAQEILSHLLKQYKEKQ